MKLEVRITWTQWYFGIWWWPVKKDRAIGICLGPLQLIWMRT